jgi:hypothetical protein
MLLALIYALFKFDHHLTPITSEQTKKYQPYAAVKIDACDFSCNAAFERSSKVMLKRDAPTLPLHGCDCHTRCRCQLIHFDDRRQSNDDRRSGSRVLQDTFQGDERRSVKRGRRATDYQVA